MSASSNDHLVSEESERVEEVDLQTCLKNADELKLEGNDHFRGSRWGEALVSYQSGLGQLPKRRDANARKPISREDDGEDSEDGQHDQQLDDPPKEEVTVALSESEVACAKARAVLNANIGACYLKLGEHKHVVEACSESLHDDPTYIKALQRRAAANDVLNTWSSLTSVQEDYNTLLNLLPDTSTERADIRRKLSRLTPRIEAAQKTETAEMLGKLKGLGNSILGNFGLSTDNFQFTPNGQGGYGMSFNR